MDNAERMRQWFDVIWNQRALDRIPELVSPNVTAMNLAHEAIDAKGLEELTQAIRSTLDSVDEIKFKLTKVLSIGDCAAAHWIARGSANGQSFLFDGLTLGKWDENGMMLQGDNQFDTNVIMDILKRK